MPAAVLRPDFTVKNPLVAQVGEGVLQVLLLLPAALCVGNPHVHVKDDLKPPHTAELHRALFPRLRINDRRAAPPAFFLERGDKVALEVGKGCAVLPRAHECAVNVFQNVEPGGAGNGKSGVVLLLPDRRPMVGREQVRAAPSQRLDRLVKGDARKISHCAPSRAG